MQKRCVVTCNDPAARIIAVAAFFIAVGLHGQTTNGASAKLPDWENPLIFAINKLPPCCSAWPCPDEKSGWKSSYDNSPWVCPLDGDWLFHWSPDPDSRPLNFYKPSFDATRWNKIPVPSCWELQGYGVPVYVNYTYPLKVNVPFVTNVPPQKYTTYLQRDPIGSYRKCFVVPSSWKDGRTLIHFAGVGSAMYVWVNGHKVGFSEDSRAPAEFDITDYLTSGTNLLAVEVYKYSEGSYLEDQDMWRLAGIFRDVFLYHTPEVSLWDFCVNGDLATNYQNAAVSLHYTLRNCSASQADGLHIRLFMRAPNGRIVGNRPLLDQAIESPVTGINPERMTSSVMIQHPLLWTSETPNVYDALVELVQNGKVIETRRTDFGFRKIEVRDEQFFVNGVSIKMKGINRHEIDPASGYHLTEERMKQDICLIKQANFNFVRTSHYTDDPRWYELCDRYGLFVMDENNLETHGISYQRRILPGDDPKWLPAVVDRMRRTVIRDRNIPSVVMWSLGNEAGWGNDFMAMRKAARAADPQLRPIHYADMNRAADIDSQTYPTVEWLLQDVQGKAIRKGEHGELGSVEQHGPYPTGKPFVANEYAHAQENSLGNLQDYWDVFEKYPMLLGGFIWEWADQTLYKTNSDGHLVYAYGGDFGDEPNDGRFCVKGLVSADRVPHPQYWEAKKVQQYVKVTADDLSLGRVRIHNKYFFTGLGNFDTEWVLEKDGTKIGGGPLKGVDAAPGTTQVVTIPWGHPQWQPGAEYFLTVKFRLHADTLWAKAGFEVAWDQIPIPVPQAAPSAPILGKVSLDKEASDWVASVQNTTIRVNGQNGWLKSFSVRGHELLAAPLRPNFWRVPTDNDLGWHVPEKMGKWKDAVSGAELQTLAADTNAEGVRITAAFKLPVDSTNVSLTYVLHGDGNLSVELHLGLVKSSPELPRIGVTFAIPEACDQIRWYGRGPQETYCDRKTGAAVGSYQTTVAKWVTPYVRPQENANRTDVRWIQFSDANGHGLFIQSGQPLLGVSAWPYSANDLEEATHYYQLPHRHFITVNLDGWQMGVGGDSSWGLPVHTQYRILKKGDYDFLFVLRPLSSSAKASSEE